MRAILLRAALLAAAHSPCLAQGAPSPNETILVIAHPEAPGPLASALEPTREGRLATLPDLFATTPGVLVQPVFGGIDHPRLAVRGSGLQRGTMPAGRGVELRLDGLPMTFADTSFDFVEWIEPLGFSAVSTHRGGRGALVGASSLGGVIDFRSRSGEGPATLLGRAEAGSFGYGRGQLALAGESGPADASLQASWFRQQGFRDHSRQEAWRASGNATAELAPGVRLKPSFLWSSSRLELPGPQTLAQVAAGDRSAQAGNVRGDWRRQADRMRAALDLSVEAGATDLGLGAALMQTDVDFRRRDILVEDNRDIAVVARVDHRLETSGRPVELGLEAIWQDGRRSAQLYLNGGGTIQSFTGRRGRLWADNLFLADRLTLTGTARAGLGPVTLDAAAGFARHGRRIEDRFTARAARPAAEMDRSWHGFQGLVTLSGEVAPGLTLFGGVSRLMEPPTFDLLFLNLAGAGAGDALVDGANPRRPAIATLDAQRQTTAELGLKGRLGPVGLDVTLYRAWLRGEFVSTADFVSQVVTSVGNAGATRRWGVEAALEWPVARPGLLPGDSLDLSAQWTFIDARFPGDPLFGDGRLPVQPPHVGGVGLSYAAPGGPTLALFGQFVPQGGYADYANSVRGGGYATFGARLGWSAGPVLLFVEGRNLGDRRYVSTVIAAQNNLGGADSAAFAPGEGRAVTAGAELSF